MHIGPEESGTARDAALNAGQLSLAPNSDRAADNRRLMNATFRLLGHEVDDAALQGVAAGETGPMDLRTETLGGPEGDEESQSAASDLPADFALNPDFDSGAVGNDSMLGLPQSIFGPEDSAVDSLPGPQSLLSTDPGSMFDSTTFAPTAAAVDWSDQLSSASIEVSAPSSADSQGFDTAGESSVDGSVGEPQSEAGNVVAQSITAGSDGEQSGSVTSLSVALLDRQQLVAAATASVAALAASAARSTTESLIDQRLSSLRTEDDARRTARAAIFGS